MSARDPRVEVVRSDAGWFGRYIASNGKEIWRTSEVYTRRRGVERAVELVFGPITQSPFGGWPEVHLPHLEWPVEVRDVDERERP